MAKQLLSEAEKVRCIPGIVYVDGAAGRRAHVQGTGLDVFEIIESYHSVGDDEDRLADAFEWLSPAQLQAALDFYAAFPEEIDARLAMEASITPETLHILFPDLPH